MQRGESLADAFYLLLGRNLTSPLLQGGAPDEETAAFKRRHPDFAPHYEKFILPLVADFEADRIAALKFYRLQLIIFVIVASVISASVIAMLATANSIDRSSGNLVMFAGGFMFAHWYLAQFPLRRFKLDVKNRIFPKIFSFFGDDFDFSETPPISVEDLKPSHLIPNFYVDESQDYVRGSYKGVKIELMETLLTNNGIQLSVNGQQRNKKYFDGLIVRLSLNKRFNGQTVVRKDGEKIGNWFTRRFTDLQPVQLEDPEFEQHFDVYATDQVEARYLLTPSFMIRLLALAFAFRSAGLVQCSFYDSSLLLMIPTIVDRFEPTSIYSPATFLDDIDQILREMAEIFGIIDALKLDERTGL